jgi:hypothetical protein
MRGLLTMSTTTTTDSDELRSSFIDQFNADFGNEVSTKYFTESGIYIGEAEVVGIFPDHLDKFGTVDLGDIEGNPDSVCRKEKIGSKSGSTSVKSDFVEVTKNETTHNYQWNIISDILDVLDEDIEYLKENAMARFDQGDSHVLFIKAGSDQMIAVSPYIVN